MNNEGIPGVMPAPFDMERILQFAWRRTRLYKNGIEMPRITCRYHRTVLLKGWIETCTVR